MAEPDLIEQLTQQAGGVKTMAPGGGVLVCFHPEDLKRFAELANQDTLRNVWLAAGGFPEAFTGNEQSVLTLVAELQRLAATVPNPLAAIKRA
jgi:hypothetical protein